MDEGVDVTDAVVFSRAKTVVCRLPKEADFLYAYSTAPGTNIVIFFVLCAAKMTIYGRYVFYCGHVCCKLKPLPLPCNDDTHEYRPNCVAL